GATLRVLDTNGCGTSATTSTTGTSTNGFRCEATAELVERREAVRGKLGSVTEHSPPPDDEAPPSSTRVLRVRRVGTGFQVFAGDVALTGAFATKEEALAHARSETADRGALILIEGEDGAVDAEAIPPSSSKVPSSTRA